jgi:hypothetical protein
MAKITVTTMLDAATKNTYVNLIKKNSYTLNICDSNIVHVGRNCYYEWDAMLTIINNNSKYNVKCDYTDLFANNIVFNITDRKIIDAIVDCINYPTDINKILHCFSEESAIKYCCSKYNVDYDCCYLSCIANKRDNNILYDYLSKFVSDVNLFIPSVFDMTSKFICYGFLDKLISKGLDCSYLRIDDSEISYVFSHISFDNIKHFCQIKISVNAYYKIITDISSREAEEFMTYCKQPDEIIFNKKSRGLLDLVDKFGISKDNLLLYLLDEYRNCECKNNE